MFQIIEAIKYGNRNPDDVDSKLIYMGLKRHFRNPQNFKDMLETANVSKGISHRVKLGDINVLDPELKYRYGHMHIHFNPLNPSQGDERTPHANYERIFPSIHETPIKHNIHINTFSSLHDSNLSSKHFSDSHQSFLKELAHPQNYSLFRHELKHYNDMFMQKYSEMDPPVHPDDQHGYFNQESEFSAWAHQKHHDISRALLQNHPDLYSNEKTLPLRKRLYDTDSFRYKLNIIDNHTLHHVCITHMKWYDHLTPENQKRAREHLEPLINKHIIKHPGY